MRNRTDLNARCFVATDGTVYRRAYAVREKMRREVSIRDNWQCRYCGKRVVAPYTPQWIMSAYLVQYAHVDHVTPVRRGGQSVPSNLRLSCVTCNIHKREADNREAVAAGVRSLPPRRSMHKGAE